MKIFIQLCLPLVLFTACVTEDDVDNLEEDVDDLVEKIPEECGLDKLINANGLSDECRDYIMDQLPEDQNTFGDNLIKMGILSNDSNTSVLVQRVNPSGEPQPLNVEDIGVTVFNSGIPSSVTLDSSNVVVVDKTLSFSLVMDYSGSMRKADIDGAYSLLRDFFNVIDSTQLVEANHIVFSGETHELVGFTESLASKLERDDEIERASTALYDGIGRGLDGLTQRNGLLKACLLVTDGGENSSKMETFDSIVRKARRENVPLVILASLLADLPSLNQLARQTNGVCIYTRELINAREGFLKFGELLNSTKTAISIPTAGADSVELVHGSQRIVYEL